MPTEFALTVSSLESRTVEGSLLQEQPVLPIGPTRGVSGISFVPETIRFAFLAALSTATVSDHALARAPAPERPIQEAGWRNYGLAGSCKEDRELLALQRAMEAEPVEDGVTHPAEELLERYVGRVDGEYLVNAVLQDAVHSADLLRLLGRIDSVPTDARIALVRRALASADVEIRDAAVQASESWDDPELAPFLKAHSEPITWLAQYVARVADDIAG